MEFNTFTQELRTLLIEGKTQAALDQLLDFYDNKKGEYYDEVIVLASQMRRLRDKSIAGAISGEEANQQANNINHSLLQIIDDLHNDAVVAKHFGMEAPKERTVAKEEEKSNSASGGFSSGSIIIAMLVGGFIAFLAIKALTPAEPLTPEEREKRELVKVEKKESQEVPSTFEPTERRITTEEETAPQTQPTEERKARVQEETTTPTPPKNDPPTPKKSFNNTPNKALPLTFDKSVRAMLNSSEDRNYFKVDITKVGRLTIDYQCLSEELRARLQVFDKNNNRILQNTASGKGASFEQSFSVREGRYVLLMETYNSNQGKYTLSVSFK